MPEQDYTRKQLSRSHTNELFRQIESSDIATTGFELAHRTVYVTGYRNFLISLFKRYHLEYRPVAVVVHPSTRSNFSIVQFGEDIFQFQYLTDSSVAMKKVVHSSSWSARRRKRRKWTNVSHAFGDWLEEVKVVDDGQKMPDLWEELRRSKEFLGELNGEDIENVPFTSDEQAEVSAQVKQIKDYIRATFELTSEQIARVDARLDQAEQASRHLRRKDWLLLFNGSVFSLILTDLITPQAGQHIIMLTVHGLGHLFGLGVPPHLPPGG